MEDFGGDLAGEDLHGRTLRNQLFAVVEAGLENCGGEWAASGRDPADVVCTDFLYSIISSSMAEIEKGNSRRADLNA